MTEQALVLMTQISADHLEHETLAWRPDQSVWPVMQELVDQGLVWGPSCGPWFILPAGQAWAEERARAFMPTPK